MTWALLAALGSPACVACPLWQGSDVIKPRVCSGPNGLLGTRVLLKDQGGQQRRGPLSDQGQVRDPGLRAAWGWGCVLGSAQAGSQCGPGPSSQKASGVMRVGFCKRNESPKKA